MLLMIDLRVKYFRIKTAVHHTSGGNIQTTQYKPCPNCGSTNAEKVKFTWWGGALGPSLFTHVKCNNCGTQFNGKTGQSNQNNIILYFVGTFLIAFCACGGFAALSYFMNR